VSVAPDPLEAASNFKGVGADDLVIKIEEFREATDWRVPISLKIGAGRLKDDIKIALKDNVDFIEIDGMQGGTGASSQVVTENMGVPSLAALHAQLQTGC